MANAIWCIINYIPEECIVFSNWQKVQWENDIRVLLSTIDNSQFEWTCIYNNQLITLPGTECFPYNPACEYTVRKWEKQASGLFIWPHIMHFFS